MQNKTTKSRSGRWKVEDLWGHEEWSGTAMIYAATGVTSFGLSGDYQVSFADESEPEDMRAARLFQASQGKRVGKVPDDKLADELVVIFGAQMTATKALATLKALISRIEDEGLMIGRLGTGDFVHEEVGQELTASDAHSFDVE